MVIERKKYWHHKSKGQAHDQLTELVDRLDDERQTIKRVWQQNTELYLDRSLNGFRPGEYFKPATQDAEIGFGWNVINAAVDAVSARLTASLPIPQFQTAGANHETRLRARKLDHLVKSIIHAEDAHEATRRTVKTTALTGTGIIHTFASEKDVCIESVHPERLIVDPHETSRRMTREMHYREYFAKEELYDCWAKKHWDLIDSANTIAVEGTSRPREMVPITETIRLPYMRQKGRRVIHCDQGTFIDEEWPYDRHPYSIIRWQPDELSWYGLSGVSQIAGIQQEIHDTIDDIRGNRLHLATAYCFLRKGAQLNESDFLTNERFKVIKGVEPGHVVTPQMADQQFFDWVHQNWAKAFEIFGLSEDEANAAAPPALRSGAALRVHHSRGTVRFGEMHSQVARLTRDIAWHVVRVCRELASRGVNVTRKVTGDKKTINSTKFFSSIKWRDVDLKEDMYAIDIREASALSSSPSGRRAELTEAMEGGLIDKPEARSLLAWPDLEQADRIANAPLEDLLYTMDYMLENGEYLPPSKHQWLDKGLEIATSYALRAKIDDVPEEKQKLLLRWIDDAEKLREQEQKAAINQQAELKKTEQEAMGPPPEPVPPPPMGMGGPPPGMEQGMAPPPVDPGPPPQPPQGMPPAEGMPA